MKTKRDPWKVALAVAAGAIVLACGGGATTSGGGDSKPGDTTGGGGGGKPGLSDVTITSCAMSTNQFTGPEAKVKITNSSSKPSNYMAQIAFQSKDGATQLDTSTVLVNGLAPGQTSEQTATSFKAEVKEQAKAGMTCKVLDVTRYAS